MATATEMSASEAFRPSADVTRLDSDLAPYKAISRSAIVSVALAAVSFLFVVAALLSAWLKSGDAVPMGFWGASFALFALVFGLSASFTIRRYPQEYTGLRMARTGLLGGALLFVAGAGVSAFTYATEVPDGYARIGFWELQPDRDRPELPVSPKAIELSGDKIFIKGYMHPGVASLGKVNHFILVPDMGTCCFGGQPKATDMIEVRVPEKASGIAYSTRRIKLAGTFRLSQSPRQSLGLDNVWYHLEVDQVR